MSCDHQGGWGRISHIDQKSDKVCHVRFLLVAFGFIDRILCDRSRGVKAFGEMRNVTLVTNICLAIDAGSCDDALMTRSTRNRIDAHAVRIIRANRPECDERDESLKTLTPKEIALQWGTTPRTLRKFLRTNAKAKGLETPGKGSRWAIEARKVASLKKGFDAWKVTQAKEKAERLAKAEAAKATESPEGDEGAETGDEGNEA